jgi:hypothetical protein
MSIDNLVHAIGQVKMCSVQNAKHDIWTGALQT